jgi:hypothetical protein
MIPEKEDRREEGELDDRLAALAFRRAPEAAQRRHPGPTQVNDAHGCSSANQRRAADHSAMRRALSSSAICTNACCSVLLVAAWKYMSGSVAQSLNSCWVAAFGLPPKVSV